MSSSSSQRKLGYILLATGGSLLVAWAAYSVVANYQPPKLRDDNITVSDSSWGYRWVTRDEQPGGSSTITVLGDGQWHDSGIPCNEGFHYRFAPSGEFHPFDVDVCGNIFNIKQPLPGDKFMDAYTVTSGRFTGTPQRPIVLFSPGGTIRVKATTNQTAIVYMERSNAQGKLNNVVRQQSIENNLGRPPEITGTEFQKVKMPPRWPMGEYLLGSYYLSLPAGKWIDTGIKLAPGNHILINTEGKFYPFNYKVGTRESSVNQPFKAEGFFEAYTVLDGAPLGDRNAFVKPGDDTVKFKVSHNMDMRVEVYQAWAH